MRPARIIALIVGCLLAPLAFALLFGGGALGLGYLTQRDADGYVTTERGVVGTGPVGSPLLGRLQMFRYEIRCWPGGRIPDLDHAVDSRKMSADRERAAQVMALTHDVPLATWGRDEQRAGEMWNSNSLVSWLLSRSGHDLTLVHPPDRGRAPGWDAGLVIAARAASAGAGERKSGPSSS